VSTECPISILGARDAFVEILPIVDFLHDCSASRDRTYACAFFSHHFPSCPCQRSHPAWVRIVRHNHPMIGPAACSRSIAARTPGQAGRPWQRPIRAWTSRASCLRGPLPGPRNPVLFLLSLMKSGPWWSDSQGSTTISSTKACRSTRLLKLLGVLLPRLEIQKQNLALMREADAIYKQCFAKQASWTSASWSTLFARSISLSRGSDMTRTSNRALCSGRTNLRRETEF